MFTYNKTTATEEVTIQTPFYFRDTNTVMMITEENTLIKVYNDGSVIKFNYNIGSQLVAMKEEITEADFKNALRNALNNLDQLL
jgi:hypothetical protein